MLKSLSRTLGLGKTKPQKPPAEPTPTEQTQRPHSLNRTGAPETPAPLASSPPAAQLPAYARPPSTPNLAARLKKLIVGRDLAALKQLERRVEDELLLADFGVAMTTKIMNRWHGALTNSADEQQALAALAQILQDALATATSKLAVTTLAKPFCFLVMGVNGCGKTTSLAKLANYYQQQGYKLHLAAGDTYRAAAVEQLQHWGDKLQIPVTAAAKHEKLESAAVIYRGMEAAKAANADIYLMDTAGRMPNNLGLREQLQKVVQVITKFKPDGPDEILLVLDASHGQSALMQARMFCEAVKVSGIMLTKLDGAGKGGVVFSLSDELQLPLRFIGTGEQLTDLAEFSPAEFVRQLLEL